MQPTDPFSDPITRDLGIASILRRLQTAGPLRRDQIAPLLITDNEVLSLAPAHELTKLRAEILAGFVAYLASPADTAPLASAQRRRETTVSRTRNVLDLTTHAALRETAFRRAEIVIQTSLAQGWIAPTDTPDELSVTPAGLRAITVLENVR